MTQITPVDNNYAALQREQFRQQAKLQALREAPKTRTSMPPNNALSYSLPCNRELTPEEIVAGAEVIYQWLIQTDEQA